MSIENGKINPNEANFSNGNGVAGRSSVAPDVPFDMLPTFSSCSSSPSSLRATAPFRPAVSTGSLSCSLPPTFDSPIVPPLEAKTDFQSNRPIEIVELLLLQYQVYVRHWCSDVCYECCFRTVLHTRRTLNFNVTRLFSQKFRIVWGGDAVATTTVQRFVVIIIFIAVGNLVTVGFDVTFCIVNRRTGGHRCIARHSTAGPQHRRHATHANENQRKAPRFGGG
uniref:Uncharacterized protein n=1 Tax=Anopheles coluzzii TaxID=1518534 RepID=A0A8W7P1E4_ANOCL